MVVRFPITGLLTIHYDPYPNISTTKNSNICAYLNLVLVVTLRLTVDVMILAPLAKRITLVSPNPLKAIMVAPAPRSLRKLRLDILLSILLVNDAMRKEVIDYLMFRRNYLE